MIPNGSVRSYAQKRVRLDATISWLLEIKSVLIFDLKLDDINTNVFVTQSAQMATIQLQIYRWNIQNSL